MEYFDSHELIPILVFLGVPLALWKNYCYDKTPFRKLHLLALIPFLLPFFIVTFAYWGETFIWALLWIQIFIHVGCFVALKGVRLSVFSLALVQLGLSLFTAAFVIIQGGTGDVL